MAAYLASLFSPVLKLGSVSESCLGFISPTQLACRLLGILSLALDPVSSLVCTQTDIPGAPWCMLPPEQSDVKTVFQVGQWMSVLP